MHFETPPSFQDLPLIQKTHLAGIAALVNALDLKVPVRRPCAVSEGSVFRMKRDDEGWMLFDRKYRPDDTFEGHLGFALKHETIDLLFLKRLFQAVGPEPIEAMVRAGPSGSLSRRAWFLYEWLLGERLDLEDSSRRDYVDVLDSDTYFTGAPVSSTRHKVRDNLLGTPAFCPVIRRSDALKRLVDAGLAEQASAQVEAEKIHPSVIARAASFLLLADSQASYQIEGERPQRTRIERWMRVVGDAGRRPMSLAELERLQQIVVEGDRFVHVGLRIEGGFIGERDWDNNPLPEFVTAKHTDLPDLMDGLFAANERMSSGGLDAVLQATCTAFGFVMVHPFEDGNGRLHRLWIHQILAERGYTPKGVTFPISSVLLAEQASYGKQLREFSGPLLPYIEWRPTERKNVSVVNDTADLYRFGDYTTLCEFLYGCVERTVTEDLPREISFLKSWDAAKQQIGAIIEMPDNTLSLLINFVRQNDGQLGRRRRENEFGALSDEEVVFIEATVQEAFEAHDAKYKEKRADKPLSGPRP